MKFLESIEKALVKLRRKRISKFIYSLHDGIISDGKFKGLKLTADTNTSIGVLGLKILGLYEKEIIDYISNLKSFDTLINLGAGDGFYPLGLLKTKKISKAICFEMTETGRKSILQNAQMNGLSDKITILNKATKTSLRDLTKKENIGRALIICDIEGGEFQYLNKEDFLALKNSTWVIELHDRVLGLDKKIRKDLISIVPSSLTPLILKSSPNNWSENEILEDLSDNDRALVLSEGRKKIGEWLILTPRKR